MVNWKIGTAVVTLVLDCERQGAGIVCGENQSWSGPNKQWQLS